MCNQFYKQMNKLKNLYLGQTVVNQLIILKFDIQVDVHTVPYPLFSHRHTQLLRHRFDHLCIEGSSVEESQDCREGVSSDFTLFCKSETCHFITPLGVTPLLFIYGGIMNHFWGHVKGIYKLLQFLQTVTITQKGNKKGKSLH